MRWCTRSMLDGIQALTIPPPPPPSMPPSIPATGPSGIGAADAEEAAQRAARAMIEKRMMLKLPAWDSKRALER